MAETSNHLEEAVKRVEWADRTTVDRQEQHDRYLREAQAHAQIAIARELRGIRVALETTTDAQ